MTYGAEGGWTRICANLRIGVSDKTQRLKINVRFISRHYEYRIQTSATQITITHLN